MSWIRLKILEFVSEALLEVETVAADDPAKAGLQLGPVTTH